MEVRYSKNNFDVDKLKEGIVRIGFFEGSRYESGKSVAEVARINEFGLGVPARPFMRPAVHSKIPQLVDMLHKDYKITIRNNGDTMKVLDTFGEYVKGLVKEQIISTTTPPNAPSTIKRKGFNAPLRDTKLMLNSVSYQTEEIFR